MKLLFKKNVWFNAVFAVILLAFGYFANANSMLADALFCISLISLSVKRKTLSLKILSTLLVLSSLFMCVFTFSSIQTSVIDIGLSDAPQLWALPAIAIVFITKFFLIFAATDTEKTDENKKIIADISKLFKLSVVITGASIVGLFCSYLLSPEFPIEGAVAFAICFIALAFNGKTMIEAFKKTKAKKEEQKKES